ncbi:MAG: hypothetical protein IPL50_04730 [Chitinophagaceae bacterium]|nr:hypothetical protein [Chitinophagaceae bacterium]
MIIYIKNMICLRCKIVVNNILESFGIEAAEIRIGAITLRENYLLSGSGNWIRH